jgi:O-antigen/teichoic acid export membrane protein
MAPPLGRSVLIYACAFAVAGVTPFLLLPILTRHLSPQQFGEVTSFLILTTMLANLAGLSSHGFVSVRYFKSAGLEFKGLVSSAALAVLGAHVVAALVVAVFFSELRQLLGLQLGLSLLAVAAAFVLSLNLIFLAIFQSSGRPVLYLRARLIQAVAEFALCVALLAVFVPDSGARIYSYAAAVTASAAAGLHFCLRNGYLGGGVDRAHLRSLATFGVPLLPHIFAGSALAYLDRLVVSSLLGTESLGIFMVAMQIGMVIVVLIEPLNKALAPWLFEQLSKEAPAARRMIVNRTYLLGAALIGSGVVVATVSTAFFDELIGPKYASAKPLIVFMVSGFVLQGMYYMVVNYLFYAEKTGRLSTMSGLTAALGCLISYSLTSSYGLIGASASFALNNAILFLLVWFAASRAVDMPWLPGR